MKVTVLTFAGLAEKLGWREKVYEVEAGLRARDLKERVCAGVEAGPLAMAWRQEYCGPDCVLEGDGEFALIPPVAGG